ncbi:MAG: hypothetical protein WA099_12675 [Sulfuricurvum sp.]
MLNSNKLSIHESAEKALEALGKESEYIDIYHYIITNSLFDFGAKKEKHEHVLRKILERKCINSNLSYKTKELLFYKKNNKYGLLKWLNAQEIKAFSIQSDKDLFIQKELESLKEQLYQSKLDIEKLNTINFNTKNFNEKFDQFQKLHDENELHNSEMKTLFDKFNFEKEKVQALLDDLKENKHQLNVAKLDKGFTSLLLKKEKEGKKVLSLLRIFGGLILTVPLTSFSLVITHFTISIAMAIPLLTIEIFLVYYFRIFLHNYNSIEEQILQLENKSSLLQFISDYMEYKQDNDVKSDDIAKFEDIIFSKISPNMKTIPTSPDLISLVEKIAKIVKSK